MGYGGREAFSRNMRGCESRVGGAGRAPRGGYGLVRVPHDLLVRLHLDARRLHLVADESAVHLAAAALKIARVLYVGDREEVVVLLRREARGREKEVLRRRDHAFLVDAVLAGVIVGADAAAVFRRGARARLDDEAGRQEEEGQERHEHDRRADEVLLRLAGLGRDLGKLVCERGTQTQIHARRDPRARARRSAPCAGWGSFFEISPIDFFTSSNCARQCHVAELPGPAPAHLRRHFVYV